jgi:hypothetical protein
MFGDLITVSNIDVNEETITGVRKESAELNGTDSIRINTQARKTESNGSDIYVRARAIYYRARRHSASRAASIF